jgi:hypothetical protein
MIRESVLNIFPSEDENSRLVIAIEQPDEGPSRLVLRQETRAAKVGWFVQSCVAVLPEQVAGLKMALSGGRTRSVQPKRGDTSPIPAILNFTEAAGRVG